MKNTIQLALIATVALIVSACGGDSNTSSNNNATGCPVGQVHTTQYNCVTQGSQFCPSGQISTQQYGCVINNGVQTGVNNCAAGQVSTQQYGCQTQGSVACGGGYVSTQAYGCVQANTNFNSGIHNGNNCSAGQVSTLQYGCATQGSVACGAGYVSTQQYGCVQATNTGFQQQNQNPGNLYPVNGACPQNTTYVNGYNCLQVCPNDPSKVYVNGTCYRVRQGALGVIFSTW